MKGVKDWSGTLSLVQAKGSRFADKVFVCLNGVRHYVPSIERLSCYALRWPDDLVEVPESVLASFAPGGWLPTRFDAGVRPESIQSSVVMREYVASGLHGFGLEIGAGSSPFPLPLGCRVIFGDRFSYDDLAADLYPGQIVEDLVPPDLIADFSDITAIADSSLDFIVGCHVIEHVLDPIGAVMNAYNKLKLGGQLLLVVPDKDRTFDRGRPLTSLKHLIEDHLYPEPERDRRHYEEFFRLALPTPDSQVDERVRRAFDEKADCHFHVWNHETFLEMINYVNGLVGWSSVWSHPTLPDVENDIEFYFRLTK